MLERSAIYRVVCEHLEKNDCVTDAVGCLHQMSRELAQEVVGEQADWTRGECSRS